jgi:predicted dehydrogenase
MTGGSVTHAYTTNRSVPEHPAFEDFGEATMIGDNGVTGYVRVDWLTPDGLGVWGDVRTTILGTKGTLEIRKYTDVAKDKSPDHLFLVDATGEHHLRPHPEMPMPYFRNLLTDCTERSETAMTQEHAFLAMELALKAQTMAQEKRK